MHASIDTDRIVPITELRNIMAATVTEIRFLNTAQAMQKYGSQAMEGPVIYVKTTM